MSGTREVEARLTVRAVDKLSGVMNKMTKSTDRFAKEAKRDLDQLSKLRGPVKLIEDFRKGEKQLSKHSDQLQKARDKVKQLGRAYKNAENPSKKLTEQLRRAQEAVHRANKKFHESKSALQQKKAVLDQAGVSVKNLASAENHYAQVLDKVDIRVQRNWRKQKKYAEDRERIAKRHAKARDLLINSVGLGYGVQRVGSAALDKITSQSKYGEGFTRFGIKAELNKAQVAEMKRKAGNVAAGVGLRKEQIAEGMFTAAEAGMNASDIKESVLAWGKVAKVAEASMSDIVSLSDAHIKKLGIKAKDLGDTLAMQYAIGASGKFEMDAMAKYGASLSAKYEALGFTGFDAVVSQSAALQVSRDSTGDDSTAANNFENFIAAMGQEATQERFKSKAGISIEKEWKKALKQGIDPLLHLAKKIDKFAKGDQFKLSEILADRQARDFVLALTRSLDKYEGYKQAGLNSSGKLDADLATLRADENQKLERFGQSISRISNKVADSLVPAIAGIADKIQPALDALEKLIDQNPEAVATVSALAGSALAVTGAVAAVGTAVAGAKIAAALSSGGWLALGTFFDGIIDKTGRAKKNIKSLKNGVSNSGVNASGRSITPTKGIGRGGGAGLAMAILPALGPIIDELEEQRKRREQYPFLGDKVKEWLGIGQLSSDGVSKSEELNDARQSLQELEAEISRVRDGAINQQSADMLAAPLEAEKNQLLAQIETLSAEVAQSGLDEAVKQQAVGVANSGLPEALKALSARIGAMRVPSIKAPAGNAPSFVPPSGARALGGPVKAGAAYQINEHGDEVAVFSQNGRVLSHRDSMNALENRSGGSLSIGELNIHAAPGMDPHQLVDLTVRRLEERWQMAGMTSYQNKGLA